MGIVWRAVDTSLDREVAIKVLPDAFILDADRVARFEREAKLVASLNHPHIAAVHSVHHADSVRFLAMELVPGRDLALTLADGPLPSSEALDYARQIAEALEAAHESGVVHRDLKPANVVLTPDGRVKILDFGLAKAFDPTSASGSGGLTKSPTLTSPATQAGMLLGTAAYMAPEQARGRGMDRRVDIWAFGCVLYEMLAGRQAFAGETVTDILAAVVTRDPDWSALPASTPRRIRELLQRCLEKDPRRRVRDAGDVRLAIEDAIANPHEEAAPGARATQRLRTRLQVLPWLVAAVGLGAALWLYVSARNVPVLQPTRLSIIVPPGDIVDGGFESALVGVSRDGRRVAYAGLRAGRTSLFVRDLGESDARQLEGTEGAHAPFFSPDGEWIAFVADGKLKKVSVNGGAKFDICTVGPDRAGVWLDDGTIVVAPHATTPLMEVSSSGGTLHALTVLDTLNGERTHRWPDALPGGEWVLYTVGMIDSPGDYESATIAGYSRKTGEKRVLLEGASMARYAHPGFLIFARNGILMAAPFDASNPKVTGTAFPVIGPVAREPTSGVVHFCVARDGTLVMVPEVQGETETELVWVDHAGIVTPVGAPARSFIAPTISPDGRYILTSIGESFGSGDLWLYDLQRETLARLTFDGQTMLGYWTPDQRRIVCQTEGAEFNVVVKTLDGSVPDRVLSKFTYPVVLSGVTPDGKHAIGSEWGKLEGDVFLLPIDGPAPDEPQRIVGGPFDQGGARVSANGRWIAFESRTSNSVEVFVAPFAGSGKWQVSTIGGLKPLWSPRGDELYWLSQGGVFASRVEEAAAGLIFGTPRRLFDIPPGRRGDTDFLAYDLAPDGKRFLMTRVAHPELARRRIDVVINWTAQLDEMRKKGMPK